jgi:hypothetical protein
MLSSMNFLKDKIRNQAHTNSKQHVKCKMKKEMNRYVSFIFHHHVAGIALKPNFPLRREFPFGDGAR